MFVGLAVGFLLGYCCMYVRHVRQMRATNKYLEYILLRLSRRPGGEA